MTSSKRQSKVAYDGDSKHRDEEAPREHSGCELTSRQRDYLVRSVVGSQAIEGVSVSRDEAEEWLDEVLERHSLKMRRE